MSETKADEPKPGDARPRKGRSPNYPGISLPKAIDRAKEVYAEVQHHPVPFAKIVVQYWGYKTATTGPAAVTYAALKRYGLLVDEGSGDERIAHLSDLAIEILHPNPNQAAAIAKAALTPAIIREWWDKYQATLPPDDTLHWQYVVRGPFTVNGLADFVRVYRETIAYAKLASADTVVGETPPPAEETADDTQDPNGDGTPPPPPPRRQRVQRKHGGGVLTYAVPVAVGNDITIEGRFPMTEPEWVQFMAVLGAMKPALVGDRADTLQDDASEADA